MIRPGRSDGMYQWFCIVRVVVGVARPVIRWASGGFTTSATVVAANPYSVSAISYFRGFG